MEFVEKKENIKICIMMLGLFGDVLLRTPILRSIKQKYPNSNITVIVDKIGYDILYNNPNVNNIIIMNRNKSNLIKYIFSKIYVQLKIIFSRYDLIIDLYNGNSSKNMINLSFANLKVSTQYTNEKNYKFKNNIHLTNQLFQALHVLNLKQSTMNLEPEFFINHKIEKSVLNSLSYLKDKNNYLISLGSGDLKKIIELEKIYQLIEDLYNNYKLIPIIVLNPGQEFLQLDLINKFLIPNNIEYIRLDKKSIDEMAVVIKYSKFFIVPDTGLFHLSLSLKTPTFCIFTHTNPKLVEPDNYDIIYKACYKIKEPKEYDVFGLENCTKEISFEDIKNHLDSFLSLLKINLKR
jgi:ADP-heptose:LPS heptosyltransferase